MLLLAVLVVSPYLCWTYPSGAPPMASICEGMTPPHGNKQSSPNPYKITLKDYTPGKEAKFTVSGDAFQGIMLQARSTNTNDKKAYGSFKVFSFNNVKTIDCGGGSANAVTHSRTVSKQDIEITWMPPQNVGDVKIVATILKDRYIWWTGTESTVLSPKAPGPAPGGDSTTTTKKPTSSSSDNNNDSNDNNAAMAQGIPVTLLAISLSIMFFILYKR